MKKIIKFLLAVSLIFSVVMMTPLAETMDLTVEIEGHTEISDPIQTTSDSRQMLNQGNPEQL